MTKEAQKEEKLGDCEVEIKMDGKAEPNEIRNLFASTGWMEEAALSDKQLDMAFNKAYCNFMARDKQGKLIGIVRSSYDGMYVMLWNLVVHPDYRRRGIGFKLLANIIDEMERREHESIAAVAVNAMAESYAKVGLFIADHLKAITTNPKL